MTANGAVWMRAECADGRLPTQIAAGRLRELAFAARIRKRVASRMSGHRRRLVPAAA